MPESVLQYRLVNLWGLVYGPYSPGICGHFIYYHHRDPVWPTAFEINGAFPDAIWQGCERMMRLLPVRILTMALTIC